MAGCRDGRLTMRRVSFRGVVLNPSTCQYSFVVFLIVVYLLQWSKSWPLILTTSAHIETVRMNVPVGPSNLWSCTDEAWWPPRSSGSNPISERLKVRKRSHITEGT